MCLLFETIKIQNRILHNIERHNDRMNESRRQLFGASDVIDLRAVLNIPPDLTQAVYKCRIVYAEIIRSIEFLPYKRKIVKSLRLVNGDDLKYEHKYVDRNQIDRLQEGGGSDDILIVKGNRITDASFANVIFFEGTSWTTPAQPLLRGTKRQLLLDIGKIHEEDITVQDLKRFQKAVLINAMIDFDERDFIDIQNIFGLDKSVLPI
jgi:4-amino-4-deoxychorismate lyase